MWHRCGAGIWWGRHGAAGIAVLRPAATEPALLLQRRAAWTHSGGTWGVPGGALGRRESALDGARREAAEEGVVLPSDGEVVDEHIHRPCPHWSYTTLLWRPAGPVEAAPTLEAPGYRWVTDAELTELRLHPGLAATLRTTGWLG